MDRAAEQKLMHQMNGDPCHPHSPEEYALRNLHLKEIANREVSHETVLGHRDASPLRWCLQPGAR